MGLFDFLRRRRDPAPVEQRAEWGSSAIPLPTEGGVATYASAATELRAAEASLQSVAVWSACDLIASVASQLPLDTYRRTTDRPQQIPNGKLVEDPGGDGQGAQDWIYQYLMSKLLRGNTFGRLLSPDPATGYPTQVYLYHPDTVMGWRDRVTGDVTWLVDGVKRTDVWHRRSYPMPGALLGLSPVRQHIVTIAQGTAAARFGLQFFTDGAMPSILLRNDETSIDPKQAAVVKARWMATMHGSREPAVFGKGWVAQPISVAPDESQFLDTQKYTSAQCARIFGPNVAEILGYETGGSMTYNNMVDRDMAFLKYTLNRWLRDLEAVFTGMLPKPQYVKFNRGALLEMDLLNRYRSYQLGISSKFLTPDEARAKEDDLPPLTDEQKQELVALNVKGPSLGGQDGDQNTARAGDADPKEQRAQPGDDEDLDDAGPLDHDSQALLTAIAELVDERNDQQRGWDPVKHPRNPKGAPGGGRFRSMVDRLKDAITTHLDEGRDGHPFDGFDREQLRRVAKARGISLKRGEDRDSIAAKLLDHIKGSDQSGTKPAADAKKTGAVKPVNQYVRSTQGIEDLARAVEDGKVVRNHLLAGGLIADTRKREYADGTFTVFKKGRDLNTITAKQQADAEQLGSLVARSLGLDAPRVYRNAADEVHMDFVDSAGSAMEVRFPFDTHVNSADGRVMGLLDVLIGNADRNRGNWLLTDGDLRPIPIDHGFAFRISGVDPAAMKELNSPFAWHYFDAKAGGWQDSDLSPQDVREVRARLARLRGDFEHIGRTDWYTQMIDRLDEVARHAKGIQPLLPAVQSNP